MKRKPRGLRMEGLGCRVGRRKNGDLVKQNSQESGQTIDAYSSRGTEKNRAASKVKMTRGKD